MKTFLRHYGPVATLLAGILVVATLLSLFVGHGRADDPRPQVVVTTYPLYVAAQNILGSTDGVRLTMLSGVGAGCLHDYQLSPADRLALERADKVIINGAGAEPFLEGLVEESRLVDTSVGLSYLCADADHHHEDHDHEHTEYNEHIWLSPAAYLSQVWQVSQAIIRLHPELTEIYTANADAYMQQVLDVQYALPGFDKRPCVLFHDSLSYLASDAHMDVKLTLSAEGESGLSAADLARVEALAKEHPDLVLLYDTQYPIRYAAIDGLVPADQVIALESAVVGSGKPSDWLDAMGRNVEKLQKLTGGDTP
ncbi:MAG: zinc ABC transporter substrate-binding protein [Clostridia bacterium]|nr:zinc ABC transporter substrate-binding protein [Clostridia bacterium]